MSDGEPVREAQRQIALILANLEQQTGMRVKHVEIQDLDVTQLGHPQRSLRCVRVSLTGSAQWEWER